MTTPRGLRFSVEVNPFGVGWGVIYQGPQKENAEVVAASAARLYGTDDVRVVDADQEVTP